MNRKKKQAANKDSGDRSEAFDDLEDEDVAWEDDGDDWSGDPVERPARKSKGRGRDKGPAAKRRSFDEDPVDGA